MHILRLYQYVLQQTNKEFAIVHAIDGYDEVSLTGDFKVVTSAGENLLSPKAVGQNKHNPVALHGGSTIEQAADIFLQVLKGKGTQAQNEVVCTNAGIAIQRFCPDQALNSCIDKAKDSLLSLNAFNNFKSLREQSLYKVVASRKTIGVSWILNQYQIPQIPLLYNKKAEVITQYIKNQKLRWDKLIKINENT